MKTTKKYENYQEQVFNNVESLELFDGDLENFWYELANAIDLVTSDKEIIENTETELNINSDDFSELRQEYVWETMESVYQTFKVEIKGEYNSEHEKLMITWDYENECYILPVFHYGTSWKYVSAIN